MLRIKFPLYMYTLLLEEAKLKGMSIPVLVIQKLKQFYPEPD